MAGKDRRRSTRTEGRCGADRRVHGPEIREAFGEFMDLGLYEKSADADSNIVKNVDPNLLKKAVREGIRIGLMKNLHRHGNILFELGLSKSSKYPSKE